MKIDRVQAFAIHLDHHYKVGGKAHRPSAIVGTPYYFEPEWRQVYTTKLMGCLVKVTTDSGIVGWGEAQAPIAPEVVATLIERLVGPAVLGCNPLRTENIYRRLYGMMNVRGHHEGFMIDAIAGIDLALWDIKGKHLNVGVAELIGTEPRRQLDAYVSGLRRPCLEENLALARQLVSEGYQGIKLFLGGTEERVVSVANQVRDAVGPQCRLMVDLLWGGDPAGVARIMRRLEDVRIEFVECPLPAEALEAYRRLRSESSIPLAMGENLRTVHSFRPWLQQGAVDVIQPDIGRTGVTEALRIAALGEAFQCDVAFHVGGCLFPATAATWHLASTIPSYHLQEHQLDALESVNSLLRTPLEAAHGRLIVPAGPGFGLDVDEEAVVRNSVQTCDLIRSPRAPERL